MDEIWPIPLSMLINSIWSTPNRRSPESIWANKFNAEQFNDAFGEMVASKLDFRGNAKFWVNWAVRNQENPEMYPLIPNQDIEESQPHEDTYQGLYKVIPLKVETRIPRLPWGSQKALIINLESSIELSNVYGPIFFSFLTF